MSLSKEEIERETSMELDAGLSKRQKQIGAKWASRTATQNRVQMRANFKGYKKGIAANRKKWKEIADKLSSKINKETSRRGRKIGEEKKRAAP